MKFLQVNVNPKNKKTGDCATRSVTQSCNIPYQEAAKELFDEWMRTGYEMTSTQTFEKVLASHGFTKFGKPKHSDNTTYSVKELGEKFGKDHIIVVRVANHWTVIKDDKLIDTWDCSSKSVYGYYLKKSTDTEELKVYGGEIKSSKEIVSKRRMLLL